jgi:hypothetical protein
VINEPVGLATTATTWYWLAGVSVLWVLSLPLLVRSWRRLTGIVMSLLGLAWLAFGFGILFRFVLLSYDAAVFASPSLRLFDLPSQSVDKALMTAGLFWLAFSIAAVCVLMLPPPRVLPVLLRQADRLSPESALPLIAVCSGCVLASLLLPLPAALITPIAVLGSMWVVPAALVWSSHFSGQRRPVWFLAAMFLPGFIRLALSPYREQILVMGLVVLASAVYARRRLNPFVMAPLVLALTIVSTVLVASYRQVLWSGVSVAELVGEPSFTEVEQWSTTPLLENLERFHVFDSLLLTVDLVPEVFPFADRNTLIEAVTRGLLPRFLNPGKEQSDQGMRFQTTFWSYYNNPLLDPEDATAAIAPSVPGSLYESGGLLDVALGGLMWGVLLAVLTQVMVRHGTPSAIGLYVLCAVQAAAGIERDYAMAVSALLQTVLLFFVLCALAQLAERRGDMLFKPRTAAPVP